MKRVLMAVGLVALATAFAAAPVYAKSAQDADVARLSAELQQLSTDPVLGQYAQAQRTLARNAIDALQNAGRSARAHDLFIATQRVALAKAAAQVDADQAKLDQLQRDHDRIMLESSQAQAAIAQAQLARQRLQYQAAVEQAQMLQAQGAQATQQAQQAQAEATQAKRLAAAQARAAALARKEASLAVAATKALQASSSASASAASAQGPRMVVSPVAFQGKTGNLTAAGRQQVAAFARAHAGQQITLTPRGTMQALAGNRAVSVEAALAAAGAGQVTIAPAAQSSVDAEVVMHAK